MRRFSYQPLAQRIVFGSGAARQDLGGECDRLGVSRLLLVATPGERARAERVLAELGERIAGEFTEVRRHVPVPTARAARRAAEQASADGLLCVGGGSTTGTAKAVALESGLPIIAVPTTYAGSEATPVWGLTEGRHKRTGHSPAVLPRTVVYDPQLTVSLPPAVTASSGMNAVAHCVAALTQPGTDPITALLAEEGIRMLARGLPAAVRDGADLDGRGAALFGAYLAGTAFAIAGAGAHHKACHALGGRYDLPHAETHTVLLPHTTALLAARAPENMQRVARALGVEDAATGLYELAERLGAPRTLADLGLAEADLDEAVSLVAEHAGLGEADARRVLAAAMSGERPGRR